MSPLSREERAGCIALRRAQQTGRMVGVYRADEAGMESDPASPWATVCEEHNTLVCHSTRRLALSWAAEPMTWCEDCGGAS